MPFTEGDMQKGEWCNRASHVRVQGRSTGEGNYKAKSVEEERTNYACRILRSLV